MKKMLILLVVALLAIGFGSTLRAQDSAPATRRRT